MSFLQRVQQGLNNAKFGINQLFRIHQVKNEIAALRQEIKQTRQKVADTTLKLHNEAMLSEPELEELCLRLDKLATDIAQKKIQIANIRAEAPRPGITSSSLSPGMRECPYCHYQIPTESVFCPGCGRDLQKAEITLMASENHHGKLCPHCKAPVSLPEAEFCTVCGLALTADSERPIQE